MRKHSIGIHFTLQDNPVPVTIYGNSKEEALKLSRALLINHKGFLGSFQCTLNGKVVYKWRSQENHNG